VFGSARAAEKPDSAAAQRTPQRELFICQHDVPLSGESRQFD